MAFGLGWEYLDHEALYKLKRDFGIRIHMPAFDLIPVTDAADERRAKPSCASLLRRDGPLRRFDHEHLVRDHRRAPGLLRARGSSYPVSWPRISSQVSTHRNRRVAPKNRRRHRLGRRAIRAHRVDDRGSQESPTTWRNCGPISHNAALPCRDLPSSARSGGTSTNSFNGWLTRRNSTKYVTMYGDVEDEELVEMYRDCEFTVFPSRVEGWGLPITESLTYGKACIHATDPAQFEASQHLMPALHPDDFLGWRDEIERMAVDAEYRRGSRRRSFRSSSSGEHRLSTAPTSHRSWPIVANLRGQPKKRLRS